MFTPTQIDDVIEMLLDLDHTTKLYFGCDSVRFKKAGVWYAKYATVLIVHKNGKNGCKIFRNISTERDYDARKNRPATRLMNEVYKVTELYLQFAGLIDEFDVEIHLDINPDKNFGSSCVATQAAGYVLGVTQINPKLKPDAFASSFGADGIGRGFDTRGTSHTVH